MGYIVFALMNKIGFSLGSVSVLKKFAPILITAGLSEKETQATSGKWHIFAKEEV